jgi:hypothetical protein
LERAPAGRGDGDLVLDGARIWRDHKLKLHQVRPFGFSRDPHLVEKVIDVVGLYLDPPKGALVLCADEHVSGA